MRLLEVLGFGRKQKTGLELKEEGMNLAAENRPSALYNAKQIALLIGTVSHWVTMDDVHECAEANSIDLSGLGNAAGSVFKGSQWKQGRYRVKSKRPSNHGREIKQWRLK